MKPKMQRPKSLPGSGLLLSGNICEPNVQAIPVIRWLQFQSVISQGAKIPGELSGINGISCFQYVLSCTEKECVMPMLH